MKRLPLTSAPPFPSIFSRIPTSISKPFSALAPAFTRVPVFTLVAVGMLCGSIVHWVRVFEHPPVSPAPSGLAEDRSGEAGTAAARLFGDTLVDPLGLIHLTGVLGPARQDGIGAWHAAAIVRIGDAAPVIVTPGATIAPGVTLEQVRQDMILVRSGARTHTIRLTRDASPVQGWLR